MNVPSRLVLPLALVAAFDTAAAAGDKAADVLATNDIPPFSGPDIGHALLCLGVAASLGTVLAFRPRRAGGPTRLANVTQAQVMLAIVGALVMLIVGASLARAFAIAGAAGLVRYRATIDDPKDASVMLTCLAVGLASGVGLLYLAAAGTAFIVSALALLEWREPWPPKHFELKVSAKDPASLKSEVESLLKRHHIAFELRESTEAHITYSAKVPQGKRTDPISDAITALHGAQAVEVEWEEKKTPK